MKQKRSWRNWDIQSKRQQTYMIPNRFGFWAILIFLILDLVGGTYSNNLVFLFAFVLVSFLLVAILQTAKNLRGLQVEHLQIPSGFPEELVDAHIHIKNPKALARIGLQLGFEKLPIATVINEIPAKDSVSAIAPFRLPSQRGRHSLERLRMVTEAPYGLFRGWLYHRRKDEFLVYPTPQGESQFTTTSDAPGDEFSGVKNYTPGDPLSRMSWKHTAKHDKLYVKEFNDRDEQKVLIDFEQCPQKDFEQKLSQLSLWICEAEKRGLLYSLHIGTTKTAYAKGTAHFHHCQQVLALKEAP